jgi:urease accessory protein
MAELVIAASVVILGALLVTGRQVSGPAALGGFALAGLFHGWAYGQAVVGSEMTAVGAYLVGFGLIQFAIAWGVAQLTARALANPNGLMTARIAAAICLGVGFTFAFENLEGLILG